MEDTSGFYKRDGEGLSYAPTCVLAPDFELLRERHVEYAYPVGGWWWFDDEASAKMALGGGDE